MNKLNLSDVAKSITMATKKHSPEILTGFGIAGMVTTTVMAVMATPKALDLLAEVKEQHAEDTDKKAFSKDVITKVAPVYIPSVLIGSVSISCLIGASRVNFKRNAALVTAYKLSETALKEYQDKVVETIGAKKEEKVRDAIAKDRIQANPVEPGKVILTEKGNTLCYDWMSGRYFRSDVEKLRKAENEINRRLLTYDYISLNELYDEIGLDHTGTGDQVGWRVDKGLVKLEFSSQLTRDDEPCLVMKYECAPEYGYDQ